MLSVNPSFADLNLISTNPGLRGSASGSWWPRWNWPTTWARRYVVVIPGRRHALVPAPPGAARAVLDDALDVLVGRARRSG